ncbi:unnamed protein product [Psylliodes chrysocephalus]|uniref:Nucleic-acid-binding protein from transposon X-element n=1 Tax=Psylliodes chrysocephalus TaxID=3402493 RepID=A0A9P0CR14_9CUCU|nr:unnamed protein product [Psylliodes chrysocephala]
MSEPEGAPKTSNVGFETEYTRRLKDRCRPDYKELSKYAKISSPQNIRKSKVKIHPVLNVSRYSIPLKGTNPNTGVKELNIKDFLDKKFSRRPSNDPEVLETTEGGITVANQKDPPLPTKESLEKIPTEGDSDDLEFHDSSDATMDSQDDSVSNSTGNSTIKLDKESNPSTIKKIEKPKYKTLPLPPNVVANLLDFKTNNYQIELNTITGKDLPKVDIIIENSSVDNTQAQGGSSNFRSEYETALPVQNEPNLNNVTNNIFKETVITSEEDNPLIPGDKTDENKLPHSPNSVFILRKEGQPITPEKEMEVDENPSKDNETPFTNPRRFSSNFQRLIREKTKKTLTPTKNRFEPLTDESDSDISDDEIGKIVKKRKKGSVSKTNTTERASNSNNTNAETLQAKTSNETVKTKATEAKQNKTKVQMPPIVIDGKTTNPNNLIQDIKALAKGNFSVKHTNYTTVLFIEDKEDHERVLANIKMDKMPYHTYTNNEDKSHAFVLRGLAEGTKIPDIEQDIEEQYEIKTRAIYRMNTKDRPLYLVVTDPAITLDYLNKNARRVLYTRVIWELRKSAKKIIQCHICQGWGHATANCGRPAKCLKCAGDHHTRTCTKTRDTPATCVNCGGDHPANYTKCKAYTERLNRLEERKKPQQQTRYVPAPVPTVNRWENRKTTSRSKEEFPALPSRSQNSNEVIEVNQKIERPRPENSQGKIMTDVSTLNHELNELNKIINIGEMTRAVRELNVKMRQCKTGQELFETYNDFMSNIDFNFNLRN